MDDRLPSSLTPPQRPLRHPSQAPAPLFDSLDLWLDETPRGGPAQMACDEALLHWVNRPLLRIFRWKEPWISAGYFIPFAEAQALRPALPVCRRWTGGGIVIHEEDFTFSLMVPRREPWAAMKSADSYCALHQVLAFVLHKAGCNATLASHRTEAGHECFAAPVAHDILSAGRKIAGGAQRRTRYHLLHQGSLQSNILGAEAGHLIAQALAKHITVAQIPDSLEKEIAHLEQEKYARETFLHRA